MFRKAANVLLAVVLFAALGITSGSPAIAQSPEPFGPGEIPLQSPAENLLRDSAQVATVDPQNTILAVSAPDDFGYTWDNSVPFSWVDATNGTDAGFSGYTCYPIGAVELPFTFKFYEKAYSQVWINPNGFISFTPQSGCGLYGVRFPVPDKVLNSIVPLLARYEFSATGPAGRVYYKSEGAAPNRRFIVEWYKAPYAYPPQGETEFTFEVILYENGDFTFQYGSLSGYYWCDDIAIGMQSWHGYDGLSYLDWCQIPPANSAVKFTRPPRFSPSANSEWLPG